MSTMLFDDSQVLKDAGIHNDDTVNFLVDCCYWKKSRKTGNNGAASAPLKAEDAADAAQDVADANEDAGEGASKHGGDEAGAEARDPHDAALVENPGEHQE